MIKIVKSGAEYDKMFSEKTLEVSKREKLTDTML